MGEPVQIRTSLDGYDWHYQPLPDITTQEVAWTLPFFAQMMSFKELDFYPGVMRHFTKKGKT